MPPARRFAILTCMDARLDPARFAGLAEGDAHVIRNAGGRASDDAIRSLVIAHKLLGTGEWFVVHHTNCGMETCTDEIMRGLLGKSLDTATVDASGWHDVGTGPGCPRAVGHSRVRLHLRRQDRRACRSAWGNEDRQGVLKGATHHAGFAATSSPIAAPSSGAENR